MISKIKKDIFIVIELINPKNVSFLYNKGRDQNDEYIFITKQMNIDSTGSFAGGEVYFSSIMDNLITQAYYNQSLLGVLKKIILGEDQSTFKKTHLRKYRDVVSANLYLIDFPSSLKCNMNNTNPTNTYVKNINKDFLKQNSNKDNVINCTNLNSNKEVLNNNYVGNNYNYENEIDNESTMLKFTFKDVFNSLLKKGTVLIGIYRAIDTKTNYTLDKIGNFQNSNFYYVVTSPDPDTEVNLKDKLFVFSQDFPEEDNMENNNKNDDKIKMNLNDEKNYDFYFGVSKNVKKNEEKKENPKILDQIGEKKLLELNEGLIHIMTNLKDLNSSISNTNLNLGKNISEAVKNKIKDISEMTNSTNQTVFSKINENSEFEEVSKI